MRSQEIWIWVDISDIKEQYLQEFQQGLQVKINQMFADGQRTSDEPTKSLELSKYLSDALDDSWKEFERNGNCFSGSCQHLLYR